MNIKLRTMQILSLALGLQGFAPALASDSDCVTMAVYYEAGNQTFIGKIGVANVIRNRKEHHRFPDTYCEVVKQKSQFEFYWDGLPEPMPKKANAFEEWALFESRVIAWMVDLLPDFTGGSLHYHNDTIERPESWKRFEHYVTIDNHEFYVGL